MKPSLHRRGLLHLASCALAAAIPASVRPAAAQPARRSPIVALVLGTAPPAGMQGPDPPIRFVRGFVHGLRDLGWIEGRSFELERHTAQSDPARAADILRDLALRRVDVIALGGERWLIDAALRATRDIPLVANLRADPVAAGLVESLARPGGNLTGVTEAASGAGFDAKRLQLLRELAPAARRIGFLGGSRSAEQFMALPRPTGIDILPAAVETIDRLDAALGDLARAGADGLIVGGDGPMYFGVGRIAAFAAERRLPAIYGFREAIEAGGLMTYGSSAGSRFRQMAKLAARFLDGAKPGEVPIEQPAAFELAINGKAAAALGLPVSAALAAQAEEVIE